MLARVTTFTKPNSLSFAISYGFRQYEQRIKIFPIFPCTVTKVRRSETTKTGDCGQAPQEEPRDMQDYWSRGRRSSVRRSCANHSPWYLVRNRLAMRRRLEYTASQIAFACRTLEREGSILSLFATAHFSQHYTYSKPYRMYPSRAGFGCEAV